MTKQFNRISSILFSLIFIVCSFLPLFMLNSNNVNAATTTNSASVASYINSNGPLVYINLETECTSLASYDSDSKTINFVYSDNSTSFLMSYDTSDDTITNSGLVMIKYKDAIIGTTITKLYAQEEKTWFSISYDKYIEVIEAKLIADDMIIAAIDDFNALLETYNYSLGDLGFTLYGAPTTGWVYEGSNWYYYEDNALVTGWKKVNNVWYYFDSNGVMLSDTWSRIDGDWYYFYSSGAMKTGWHKSGDTWYYLNSSGAMAHCEWVEYGESWYYLTSTGAMATGWNRASGKWYYFYDSGVMYTGWLHDGDYWYYLKPSGEMARLEYIDGYYLNYNGEWT